MPSSSLAASELSERIKKLLDAEARNIPGKGQVVPHNIKLKIQWDKFSTDSESSLKALETELLTAAVDHINDSLYYTYAPLNLEVKPDYFTEGVKLLVSFDKFDEDAEAEINVTVPSVQLGGVVPPETAASATLPGEFTVVASFTIAGNPKESKIKCRAGGRVSVGRTGENGLVLDDISVSKFHAALVLGESGELSVADTGSTNGTFVNGERIAYGKSVAVRADETVKFGTVDVKFLMLQQPPETIEAEPPTPADTVEIDGFEFTSKIPSPETAETEDEQPAGQPDAGEENCP